MDLGAALFHVSHVSSESSRTCARDPAACCVFPPYPNLKMSAFDKKRALVALFLLILCDSYINVSRVHFRWGLDVFKKAKDPSKVKKGDTPMQRPLPSANGTKGKIPYNNRKAMKASQRAAKLDAGIDDLENTLLGKYGASTYQDTDDWDEEDEKESNIPRRKPRFEGFMPNANTSPPLYSSSASSSSSPHSMAAAAEQKQKHEERISRSSEFVVQRVPLNHDDHEGYEAVEGDGGMGMGTGMGMDMDLATTIQEDAYNYVPGEALVGRNGAQASWHPSYRLRRPKVDARTQAAFRMEEKRKREKREHEETETKKDKKKAKKRDEGRWKEFNFEDMVSDGQADDIFTTKSFSDLGLHLGSSDPETADPAGVDMTATQLSANLVRMGFFSPTKVQELAVPAMLSGESVLIQAQTGSGKTLAYLLPMFGNLDLTIGKVQAIVLAPSRELVTQISAVATQLFAGTGLRCVPIIGGANVGNQIKKLRDVRPQLVVATPGRLAEIVFKLQKLKLGMVRTVVIDECDHMVQEPYYGEVMTLLEATPFVDTQAYLNKVQSATDGNFENVEYIYDGDDDDDDSGNEQAPTSAVSKLDRHKVLCLSSATGAKNAAVVQFADRVVGKGAWKHLTVNNEAQLPPTVMHGIISCSQIKALELLKKFLSAEPRVEACLIFVNSPHRVEVVCDRLLEMGVVAAPLHGESSKEDRREILDRMRDGRLTCAVTTELAARGLDIPSISHIVNFELPTDSQHYVHRAGRCGRAGRPGLVMNFARPDTKFVVRRFGKQLGVKVKDCELRQGRVWLKSI